MRRRATEHRRLRFSARGLLLGALLLAANGCIYVGGISPFGQKRQELEETTVSGSGRDKLLLVDVAGVITGEDQERALGFAAREGTVARVKEELRRAHEDDRVRAVILRINSPGGGVTASDTLYEELLRFRQETGRPIVAAMMDLATSGAYYIALAADEIIASPTTVTGSIGVILMGLNVEGLMGKLGVEDQSVKSGPHKDLLSPFREPTGEDRAIVQEVIDDLHERFVSRVATRRPRIGNEDLPRLTDGRIFTAEQAQRAGLVDRIAYIHEAIEAARRLAGVQKARVVMYHRPREYRENVYSRADRSAGPVANVDGKVAGALRALIGVPTYEAPRFLYLWAPGLGNSY